MSYRDLVQVLKQESSAGGGTAGDDTPYPSPINAGQDAIEAAGLVLNDWNSGTPVRDQTVYVRRDGSDLLVNAASGGSVHLEANASKIFSFSDNGLALFVAGTKRYGLIPQTNSPNSQYSETKHHYEILYNRTTDAVARTFFSATELATAGNGHSATLKCEWLARNTSTVSSTWAGGAIATYYYSGGTPVLVSSQPLYTPMGTSPPTVTLNVNATYPQVQITGLASTTIDWVLAITVIVN